MNRIGWSAGLTFWYEGGAGMFCGSCRWTALIAACTSWAAASRLRLRLNWSVICVAPLPLVEVIVSMPAIVANCFSSGVATAEAIVSGFAPGREAVTRMIGKSTFGRSLTGSSRKPMMPKSRIAAISSVVVTGRRMENSGRFIRPFSPRRRRLLVPRILT